MCIIIWCEWICVEIVCVSYGHCCFCMCLIGKGDNWVFLESEKDGPCGFVNADAQLFFTCTVCRLKV